MTKQDPASPAPVEDAPPPPCGPAELFALVWDSLCDVLGVPTTATLLRRSFKRAAVHVPGAAALQVLREGLDYRYVVPESWRENPQEGLAALRALLRELYPLLSELTGPLLVRRLEEIPELQQSGLSSVESK